MIKYSEIYIGALNNKNFDEIKKIQPLPRKHWVLLSNIDFFELNQEQLKSVQELPAIILPNKENFKKANKYKKSIEYVIFVDWLLKQPSEICFLMKNDSLLFLTHRDENWHKAYDGNLGFAIGLHDSDDYTDDRYYGHSISMPNNLERLFPKVFDGICLESRIYQY